MYVGSLPEHVADVLPALFELAVQYQLDALEKETASGLLQGLSPESGTRATKRGAPLSISWCERCCGAPCECEVCAAALRRWKGLDHLGI